MIRERGANPGARLGLGITTALMTLLGGAASAFAATTQPLMAVGFVDDVEYFFEDTSVGQILLRILLALGILVIGWVVARIVSWTVFKLLLKTTWDDRLAAALRLDVLIKKEQKDAKAVERVTSKVVYYVLLLMAVVAALQYSGLTLVAAPIQRMLDSLFQAIPKILAAAIILLVAYIVAYIVRALLQRGLGWLDQWFVEKSEGKAVSSAVAGDPAKARAADAAAADAAAADTRPLSDGIAAVVFWLIMVFGLVGALDALEINALSQPLSAAVSSLLAMLPALAKAALIVVAGYMLARIARTIITELARSVGVDRVVDRLKLEHVFTRMSLSEVLGWIAFFFIMVQITIAALNTVGLETISGPLTGMMAQFWLLLPNLAAAVLLVVAGIILGRLARGVVENVLKSIGFDRLLDKLGFGELATKNEKLNEPSEFVGLLVMIGIVLLATAQAFETLGLGTWAVYLNTFLGYVIKHVLVAVLVVIIGFALGNYVRDLIVAGAEDDGHDESRLWIGTLARYAVLVAAFTMAIIQLEVGQEFVLLAFGLVFGALCLALALAFGLGSRGVAEDIVQRQYEKAREQFSAEQSGKTSPRASAAASAARARLETSPGAAPGKSGGATHVDTFKLPSKPSKPSKDDE